MSELKKGTEDATGTRITLDRDNCVGSYTPTGEKGFDEIQSRFGLMVASKTEFGVEFGDPRELFYSKFDDLQNTALILRGDFEGGFYPTGNRFTCAMFGGLGSANQTLGGLIAHELIGHGAGVAIGDRAALQPEAIRIENLYHAARNQRPRCQGGR